MNMNTISTEQFISFFDKVSNLQKIVILSNVNLSVGVSFMRFDSQSGNDSSIILSIHDHKNDKNESSLVFYKSIDSWLSYKDNKKIYDEFKEIIIKIITTYI